MRWWPLSTCFAAKMIQSFPGKLAFDDLAFDNFPIIGVYRGQGIWTGPTDRPGKPRKTRLRGIFADTDAVARRKVR